MPRLRLPMSRVTLPMPCVTCSRGSQGACHGAPSLSESRALLQRVHKAPNREEGFQDVLWALLNSKEFLFNH
jgi:hypothetical protein